MLFNAERGEGVEWRNGRDVHSEIRWIADVLCERLSSDVVTSVVTFPEGGREAGEPLYGCWRRPVARFSTSYKGPAQGVRQGRRGRGRVKVAQSVCKGIIVFVVYKKI